MSLSSAELARRLGATVSGERAVGLAALAVPAVAGPRDLSPCLHGHEPRASRAGAWLVAREGVRVPAGAHCVLLVDDVLVAWARASAWLPVRRRTPAHSPSLARVADSARVATRAVIADGARIGAYSEIGDGASIGASVSIGDYARIGPGAVIAGDTRIGNRVHIGAGCVIGEDGFALVRDGACWLRMPGCGGVEIGDDVLILAGSTVHAGVFGDTRIGAAVALDSQVLIGHDSSIGAGTVIAGQTAVAGAAMLGRGCVIGAKVGIGEGVRIAPGVTVTAMSMVTRSLETDGARYSSGWPAEPSGSWWRRVSRLRRLARPPEPPAASR